MAKQAITDFKIQGEGSFPLYSNETQQIALTKHISLQQGADGTVIDSKSGLPVMALKDGSSLSEGTSLLESLEPLKLQDIFMKAQATTAVNMQRINLDAGEDRCSRCCGYTRYHRYY